MAQSKNRPSDDEIAQRIGEILEAIRTPEHADDIIEIRKIVRKNVPFFFRSYFAAYLLKDSLMGGFKSGAHDRDRDRNRNQPKREQQLRESGRDSGRDQGKKGQNQEPKQNRSEPKAGRQEGSRQNGARQNDARLDGDRSEERKAEDRKNERMAPLPEGVEAATLFVSAGRKRHFYPRHLLELFAGADIPRESIGEIRLFDNYTFVQIIASDAARAVENLDGAAFKGRKLTVNFARKKDEANEDVASREEAEPRGEFEDGDEAHGELAGGDESLENPAADVDRGYGDEEVDDDFASSDDEEDASFDDTIDDESDFGDEDDEFDDEPEDDSDPSDPTKDA